MSFSYRLHLLTLLKNITPIIFINSPQVKQILDFYKNFNYFYSHPVKIGGLICAKTPQNKKIFNWCEHPNPLYPQVVNKMWISVGKLCLNSLITQKICLFSAVFHYVDYFFTLIHINPHLNLKYHLNLCIKHIKSLPFHNFFHTQVKVCYCEIKSNSII